MTASTALRETRVPRQVTERLNASVKRYTDPEPATPNPAADAAPADPPAAPAATPAHPQADPPADPRHADPNYWRQRFDVTSGILAREREQRLEQVAALNVRLTELHTEVQTLKQAAPEPEIDLTTLFTKEQIEAYGEEQCRVMAQTANRAAKAEAQKLIDAAVQPLKQLRESEATTNAETRKQAFQDKLTELFPEWPDTDKDARWHEWLAQEDEHGATRQSILTAHVQAFNAVGAAKMFRSFAKTIAVPPPPVVPSGSGAGAGEGAPAAQSGLTAPTGAEVKDYYKRSALGKVKDSERVEFEARMKLRDPRR
jgi:hypothetical protein